MENRLYPLREMLAELLLEANEPAAALRDFETALQQTPNNYRAVLGFARAANASGDLQKALVYYGKLLELSKKTDTERVREGQVA
jgi:Tfp pilus assembly protein PilF